MAARHALGSRGQRREAEKQQERGKDEEAGTVLPMRDLSPGSGRQGSGGHLLPTGKLHSGAPGAQIPSTERDEPHWGP